jgi:opacity protein-like surface antigen
MTPLFLLAAIPAAAMPAMAPTPISPAPTAVQSLVAQAAPATNAAQPNSYPYFSLQLGVGFPRDYEGSIDAIDTDTTLDLNTGFNAEAAIGYKINDFRTDLSVGFGNFGVDQQHYSTGGFGSASVDGDGAVNLWTVMANAYYDIPIWKDANVRSSWSPYIGAGVGYANISTPACSAGDCYSGGSAGAFAWQAKLGVSYRATERGFAFLEGGYVGTAGNTTVDDVSFGSFGAWRVNLGWRQGFGGAPKAKPVAVVEETPEPAPAATPAPEATPEPQAVPIRGLW